MLVGLEHCFIGVLKPSRPLMATDFEQLVSIYGSGYDGDDRLDVGLDEPRTQRCTARSMQANGRLGNGGPKATSLPGPHLVQDKMQSSTRGAYARGLYRVVDLVSGSVLWFMDHPGAMVLWYCGARCIGV